MLAIAVLIGIYTKSNNSLDEFSIIPIKVDYPAPVLTLEDMNGERISLSDLQGKIVLVNNWATWCPPCKAELPTLEKYYQSHASQDFVILAIEAGDPLNEIEEMIKKYSLTFTVLQDPANLSMKAFGNWDLPSSYVIDRTGQIRLTWTGQINLPMLNKYVSPLLDE